MNAYGDVPNALLDVREAANHPWMGLTALLNQQPYLVVGKTGNKFILEGEAGDTQTLLQFEWKDATEDSRLIAASRQEGSALTKGSRLGGYTVGGIRHHEGEWYVMNESGEEVLPFHSILARIESHRNDPQALAYEIRQAADRKRGLADFKCPACKSSYVSFDEEEDDCICQDCSHVASVEEFDAYDEKLDWYPSVKTASVFEMQLPPHGIHFRTYSTLQEAGLTAKVTYPPIPAYPDGLVSQIPGPGAISDMDYSDEIEMGGGNLPDVTVQVETPDGMEEQVRSIIDKLGGAVAQTDDQAQNNADLNEPWS